jgi:hypothetical protein
MLSTIPNSAGSMGRERIVDFDGFTDPARWRVWLLTKALEYRTLPEALQLARAAEDFLTEGKSDTLRLPSIHAHQSSTLIH